MSFREMFTQEFWDERYRGKQVWSGRPNPHLVSQVSELAPGRALDVGCGEGEDAIWLAERGWTVTGADVSPVALERAAEHAQGAGRPIAERIEWRQADLFAEDAEPFGTYDLVNSQYLHMPIDARERAVGRLASSAVVGGRLLVIAHHPSDLEIPGLRPNLPELFCTAPELAELLDPEEWEIVFAGAPERVIRGPGGDPVTIHDAVLHALRHRALTTPCRG
jgi:SAM-dependent methyltransferase